VVAAGIMGLDCTALPAASPALRGSLLEDGEEPSRRMKRTVHCSLLMCNARPRSSALNNRNCHAASRNSQRQMLSDEEKGHVLNHLDLVCPPTFGKSAG